MRKRSLPNWACGITIAAGLLSPLVLGAQMLKHSYTFEEGTYNIDTKTVNDVAGTVNGTLMGSNWQIANGAMSNTNAVKASGGYLSFSGVDLGLSGYSAITMEAYLTTSNDPNNPNRWTMLSYFGNATGAKSYFMSVERNDNVTKTGFNQGAEVGATGTEPGKNELHHYVSVLKPATADTDGSVALYIDGVKISETALPFATATNQTAVSGIGTDMAYLFNGGYNDPLWTGSLHEFNIYDGAMDATAVAARYAARNAKLSALTVGVGTLVPAFNANINNYSVVLPQGTATLDVASTADQSGAAVTGVGTIDVSGQKGSFIVRVDAAGAVPYTVYWEKPLTAPVLKHAYTFNDGTANDAVGGANGVLKGAGTIANGLYTALASANFGSGNSQYIELPAGQLAISQYGEVTMEATVRSIGTTNPNPFIAYFGGQALSNGNDYLFVHPTSCDVSCKTYNQPWKGTSSAGYTTVLDGKPHHLVLVASNTTLTVYRDGVLAKEVATSDINKLFNLRNQVAYIGRSGYVGDGNLIGSVGEFNIYQGKMDATAVAARYGAFQAVVAGANLASLSVAEGTISPEFSADVQTYNVTVASGTTSVNVSALAANEFATVAGAGAIDVSGGSAVATVKVTSGDGVTVKDYVVNISVSAATSVSAPRTNDVSVYPTSTPEKVNVRFMGELGAIAVYDITGKMVASQQADSQVEILALPRCGIYFVQVTVDGTVKTVKVVRNK